ncbi:hypothetical protein D3C81_2195320 [compost metagenome]
MMAVCLDLRLGSILKICQRPIGPLDPVPILGPGQIEKLIGFSQHLQELPRRLSLMRRSVMAHYEDAI